MALEPSVRINLGLVAVMFVLGIVAFRHVPAGQLVAIHFGADGTPDGWAHPVAGLFLVPALALGCVGLQVALPRLDPRGENLRRSARAVGTIMIAVILVLAFAQGWIVAAALGIDVAFRDAPLVLAGTLFVVVGNVMGKLRWNRTVGIRTPWTLADERVWDRTHRFGGKLLVAAGVALLLALAVPAARDAQGPLIVAVTFAAVAGMTLKSYLLWRERGPGAR